MKEKTELEVSTEVKATVRKNWIKSKQLVKKSRRKKESKIIKGARSKGSKVFKENIRKHLTMELLSLKLLSLSTL